MGREVSGSRAFWTVSLTSQQAQGQWENLTQKIMWREEQEDTWHWPLVSPYTHIGEHTSSTHMHVSMYTCTNTTLTCMHINSPCWGQYCNGSLWTNGSFPWDYTVPGLRNSLKLGAWFLTVMLAVFTSLLLRALCGQDSKAFLTDSGIKTGDSFQALALSCWTGLV